MDKKEVGIDEIYKRVGSCYEHFIEFNQLNLNKKLSPIIASYR